MDEQNNAKGEHYNLRWNNYTNNLIQVFSEHQHHETLVDVTLTCEGQYIKAHKLILSACSGFFQEMFNIHSSIQHPIIILNNIKFNHLKYIIEFIYQGEIKVLDTDLEGVLKLGESFQVKGLSSVKLKHSSQNDQNKTLSNEQVKPMQVPPLQTTHPFNTSLHTQLQNMVKLTSSLHKTPIPILPKPSQLPNLEPDQGIGFTVETSGKATLLPQNQNQNPSLLPNLNLTNNVLSNFGDASLSTSLQNISNCQDTLKNTNRVQVITDKEEVENFKNAHIGDMEPPAKKSRTRISVIPKNLLSETSTESIESSKTKENVDDSEKIPRPPNAFMLFANDWRKKLEMEYPDENNKGISIRLGYMWKSLSSETKQRYYSDAKKALEEYDKNHPGYIHSLKNKRMSRKTYADATKPLPYQENQDYDDDLQIVEITDQPIDISRSTERPNT